MKLLWSIVKKPTQLNFSGVFRSVNFVALKIQHFFFAVHLHAHFNAWKYF